MCDLRHRLSRPAAIVAVLLTIGCWLWPDASQAGQDVSSPPSDFGVNPEKPRFADTRDFVHVLDVRQAPSNVDELMIILRVDPGFHINANPASFEYLLATRLAFVGVEPVNVVYPSPVRFKPKFVDEPLDVYEGTITIEAYFPHGALARNSIPQGAVAAQACTDEVCLPPAELPLHR